MQKGLYQKSWQALFNNLILALPDIAYLFLSIIGIALFGYFSGIFEFIADNIGNLQNVDMLLSFVSENLAKIIIALIGFIIYTFFVGVGRDALKYGMINDLTNDRKTSLRTAWRQKHKFYLTIVWLKMKLFSIYLGISVIFGLIIGAAGFTDNGTIKWLWVGVFTSLLLLVLLLLSIALMFKYAIMFNKGYDSTLTIKESFRLFRKEYKKFFYVLIILFLTQIGVAIIFIPISKSPALAVIYNVVTTLIFSIWKDIYIFYTYKG